MEIASRLRKGLPTISSEYHFTRHHGQNLFLPLWSVNFANAHGAGFFKQSFSAHKSKPDKVHPFDASITDDDRPGVSSTQMSNKKLWRVFWHCPDSLFGGGGGFKGMNKQKSALTTTVNSNVTRMQFIRYPGLPERAATQQIAFSGEREGQVPLNRRTVSVIPSGANLNATSIPTSLVAGAGYRSRKKVDNYKLHSTGRDYERQEASQIFDFYKACFWPL